MKLLLPLTITILAFLGILDAGYIAHSEITGNLPPCKPPFACREVLESSWSHVGPIPLYALGFLYYLAILVLGFLIVTEQKILMKNKFLNIKKLLAGLSIFGALFSLWLLFVMGVILKAWCLYCLFSAFNCLIIFILSIFFSRKDKESYALHI
jgi:uncharacterized membrane protein